MLDTIQPRLVSVCSLFQIFGEYRASLKHRFFFVENFLLNEGTVVVAQLTFNAWGRIIESGFKYRDYMDTTL